MNRQFVIALRTGEKNTFRAAQEIVAIPKSDQKSTIPVCADQEFSRNRIPFANRTVFRAAREAEDSTRICESGSNSWIVSTGQVHTNQNAFLRINWRISAHPKSPGPTSQEDLQRRQSFMERRVDWAQCRELRAASDVPPTTYWIAAITRSETCHRLTLTSSVFTLGIGRMQSRSCWRRTASHFPWIGVPSAQRSGGTVG